MPTPTDVSTLASLACLLEAGAAKPGNVSPGRRFGDMEFADFAVSAVAIGPVLAQAGQRPLGEVILDAVRATRRWTPANTNLGIVLLLAPLARAALAGGTGSPRERVTRVLAATTTADARAAYAAIREAAPGGLGTVDREDVAAEPGVPLRQAMALAAERDSIAAEYAGGFGLTFETGVRAVRNARAAGLAWEATTTETFLVLLAARPDSLIARKLGADAAAAVSRQAAEALAAGGVRTEAGRARLAAFDAALRDSQNSRNPGTTADLTAAALFAALLEDGWAPDDSRTRRAQ